MADGRKLLTTDQVAEFFQVEPYTVREWLKDQNHPLVGIKLKGGQWRVRESVMHAYAQERHG